MKPDTTRPIVPGEGPRWAYAADVRVGDRVTMSSGIPGAARTFTVEQQRTEENGMAVWSTADGEYFAGPRAVVITNRPGVAL